MPVIPQAPDGLDEDVFRVLITGFGPFASYKENENPSWLAAQRLHNTILMPDSSSEPVFVHDQVALQQSQGDHGTVHRRKIHITALKVPTKYDAVLSRVPGLHERPPVLPVMDDPIAAAIPPPAKGYDFILHVGAGLDGAIQIEDRAHKTGYNIPDVDGKMAPLVESLTKPVDSAPSNAENREMDRMMKSARNLSRGTPGVVRGFAEGYEEFADELRSPIHVDDLVRHLQGIKTEVEASPDAGRFLCDFIYYCSLAERERHDKHRPSKVLFMHCPPVHKPLGTEQVAETLKQVVLWVERHSK